MNSQTPGRKPPVEFFFSFRSPYSYLAAPRAFALPQRYAVELVWRGVRPMAMRGQPLPLAKQLYILRDATREADGLGLPFGPMYDPIGDGVWRCLCIAEHALEAGKIATFVTRAATAIWSEAIDVRNDRALRRLCESAGLEWAACERAMQRDDYRERVEANTARLAELGHWGVPTFAFDGQLYWGQDRIADLELALSEAGLHRSNGVVA
jgi:2-hydroxychromene-2-carboxylate isomerase